MLEYLIFYNGGYLLVMLVPGYLSVARAEFLVRAARNLKAVSIDSVELVAPVAEAA